MNTFHLNLPPATVPAPPLDRPSLQKVPTVVLQYRLRLLLPGTLHHYLCGYASTIPSDKQHYNTIAAFIRSNNTWALPLELLVQQTNISDGAFPRSPTHDFMISLTGLYVGQRALPTFRVGPNDMKALGAAFKCSAFLNKYSPGEPWSSRVSGFPVPWTFLVKCGFGLFFERISHQQRNNQRGAVNRNDVVLGGGGERSPVVVVPTNWPASWNHLGARTKAERSGRVPAPAANRGRTAPVHNAARVLQAATCLSQLAQKRARGRKKIRFQGS